MGKHATGNKTMLAQSRPRRTTSRPRGPSQLTRQANAIATSLSTATLIDTTKIAMPASIDSSPTPGISSSADAVSSATVSQSSEASRRSSR
jgi:hypothetical protein